MIMKNRPQSGRRFTDQSDAELASNLRMVAAEKWKMEQELTARGYNVGCTLRYEDGGIKIDIDRVEKQAL
jgi:hypothetical protein